VQLMILIFKAHFDAFFSAERFFRRSRGSASPKAQFSPALRASVPQRANRANAIPRRCPIALQALQDFTLSWSGGPKRHSGQVR
jgi:hypothetical protein